MSAPNAAKSPASASSLVLVVDDDPVQRRQIAIYLGRLGVKTVEAEDGDGAIQVIRKIRPAVIIMDILMPRMDGIEVARAVAGIYDAKVILMTGDPDSLYRANVSKLKVFAVIEKPIPLQHLSRFVLQALDAD